MQQLTALVCVAIVFSVLIALPAVASTETNRVKAAITWAFCGHHYRPCEYGRQAIEVSRCETGGTFSIWAKNGQHLGLFQMGDWERRTYGHGHDPWHQAAAAYRYFVASGRNWSPWSCKP